MRRIIELLTDGSKELVCTCTSLGEAMERLKSLKEGFPDGKYILEYPPKGSHDPQWERDWMKQCVISEKKEPKYERPEVRHDLDWHPGSELIIGAAYIKPSI